MICRWLVMPWKSHVTLITKSRRNIRPSLVLEKAILASKCSMVS
jgi:hypothetical protein